MQQNSEVVKLNVGGKKYQTTITTLNQYVDNFLANLVKNHGQDIIDGKEIFIDRNPKYFKYILDYLRQPQIWTMPDNIDIEILIREADFYGLTNLLGILNKKKEFINKYGLYNSFVINTLDKLFTLTVTSFELEKDFEDLKDIKNKDISYISSTTTLYINKFAKIGYEFISAANIDNRIIYLFKVK